MVIKSRRLRRAGHVARVEEGRSFLKILTGKPTGEKLLESVGVDERVVFQWILKK